MDSISKDLAFNLKKIEVSGKFMNFGGAIGGFFNYLINGSDRHADSKLKAALRGALRGCCPWIKGEPPVGILIDKCPVCGHETKFSTIDAPLDINSEHASWTCAKCSAARTWGKDDVRQKIWSYYEKWLSSLPVEGIYLSKLLSALKALYMAKAVQPYALIRFGVYFTAAMGHLAINTAFYVLKKQNNIEPVSLDFIGIRHNERISNHYLLNKWITIIDHHVSDIAGYMPYTEMKQPEMISVHGCLADMIDYHDLVGTQQPVLIFTEEENKAAHKELERMGIPEGSKFICLHTRDNAYHKKYLPFKNMKKFDIVALRSVDIDTYRLAIEKLASDGYYVLRMGAVVERPLNWSSERIIDYATHHRSEFMDVWLFANCYMCVTMGSGPDAISLVCRRNMVWTNLPIIQLCISSIDNIITIFKHIKKSGEELSLDTLLNTEAGGYYCTASFENAGLEVVDNTPEEIDEAVQEMVKRLDGQWTDTAEDDALQEHFYNQLKGNKLHGKVLRGRIGSAYLRRMQAVK